MRLSKQATLPVSPKDFWMAVAVATVLVSGIGFYTMEVQHLPVVKAWLWISPWLWGGTLIWIWVRAALQGLRLGRRALPWPWVMLLIGYTLFAGGPLLPHAPAVVSWLSNIGLLMVLTGVLSPYVGLGRRRKDSSKETG